MDFLNLDNRKVKGDLTVVYKGLVRQYNVDENTQKYRTEQKMVKAELQDGKF